MSCVSNLKEGTMKTYLKTVRELVKNNDGDCPLPLDIIPDKMGINLCSVDSIGWQKQDDGQLVSLTMFFIPSKGTE